VSGLRDVVTELADQVRAVLVSADVLDVQVEPRMVLNPSPLTIDFYPGDPSRDAASAAFDELSGGYLITARARINTPDFDASYDHLLSLMDDEDEICLAAAVEDDPTLNGHATSVSVQEFSGLRAYEHPSGEGAHLGFQLLVLVIPARS
jgi:hypothetical protein